MDNELKIKECDGGKQNEISHKIRKFPGVGHCLQLYKQEEYMKKIFLFYETVVRTHLENHFETYFHA